MGVNHLRRRLATGVNGALVAAMVVVAIQLGIDVAGRTGARWDLSLDAQATLSVELVNAIERLEASGRTLQVTAFSVQQKDDRAMLRDRMLRDWLTDLEATSAAVSTRFVDFDRDPLTAERMGVDRYGTVVLAAGDDRVDLADRALFRRRGPRVGGSVDFVGESAVVAGIEQLLAARTRQVYALKGHGEKTPFDRGLGDLVGLSEVLATLGLRTRALDLLRSGTPEIPEDAALVLILGPTAPYTPGELAALRTYLEEGGALGVWLEPEGMVPALVEELGVLRPTGVVLDARSMAPFEDRPLLQPRRHPIGTQLAEEGLAVVGSTVAPIEIVQVAGVRAEPVLGSSATGWIERGTERPATLDPTLDQEGPIDVAAALIAGEARALVVGDLDLVGDPLIDEGPGNRAFAAAAVRWLLGDAVEDARIGKVRSARTTVVTPAQLSRLRVVLVGLWPLVILAIGAAIRWWRART